MAGILESEAVFAARAKAFGISDEVIASLKGKGWSTHGSYAFSCGHTPGAAGEQLFVDSILKAVLGEDGSAKRVMDSGLRRLFFESYTLCAADMRSKVERSGDDAPRKLPTAERNDRLDKLIAKMSNMTIDGPNEPSNHLVDIVVSMHDDGVLRYITWAECTTTEMEMNKAKVDKAWMSDSTGLIREHSILQLDSADTGSDLKLVQALTRRGLALEMGRVCSFNKHEVLVRLLIGECQRSPPAGFRSTSLAQVERTDREVFKRIAELTRSGLQGPLGGPLPFEVALDRVLLEAGVRMLLIPMQGAASVVKDAAMVHPTGTEAPVKKKTRNEKKRLAKVRKAEGSAAAVKTPTPPPSSRERDPRVPKSLSGKSKTPSGEDICFSYNSEPGCSKPACTRKHVCMVCFKEHPLHKHSA